MASKRILIVEDEGIVVLHIKKALENLNYDICGIASSGDDAITKAMKNRPDLVLMDIMLKGLIDGIDAAEKIRAIFGIPVIFLTAHADEMTLQRAKVTEPYGYILKPFRERDLYIAIEFALYKASMEAERNEMNQQLKEAFARIKTLQGLIPICAWCKKVRDDKGYWERLDEYVTKNSGADFTHGICPQCMENVKKQEEE